MLYTTVEPKSRIDVTFGKLIDEMNSVWESYCDLNAERHT